MSWFGVYVHRKHSSVFSYYDLDKIPVPAISVFIPLRTQIASPEKKSLNIFRVFVK